MENGIEQQSDTRKDFHDLPTAEIHGLEIFQAGKWNGDSYSIDDLHAMANAFRQVGFKPTVKAGHADGQEDAEKAKKVFGVPALGYVSNLYVKGDRLVADVSEVPRRFADLIKAGAYKRVSAEIYWSYKDRDDGESYPRVLKSVAFLGAEIPAITSLKAVESLYQHIDGAPAHAYSENGKEFRVYCGDCAVPVQSAYSYPRKSKQFANYREADGTQRCGNCRYYSGPSCNLVEGYVEANYVSDLYDPIPGVVFEKKREVKEYVVEKRGDKWCLLTHDGSETLGCHDTEDGALAQEKAIQANKHARVNMETKIHMSREDVKKVCPSCSDKMEKAGIASLSFEAAKFSKVFKFMGFDECMKDAAMLKEYPDEADRKSACGKMKSEMMERIEAEIKAHSAGGETMDEKELERIKAEAKAEAQKEFETKLAAAQVDAEQTAKEENRKLTERLQKLEAERRSERVTAWIDKQREGGKIAPVEEPKIRCLMEQLSETTVVKYSEGGKEKESPTLKLFREFIEQRPSIFKELSTAKGDEGDTDEGTPVGDVGMEVVRQSQNLIAQYEKDSKKITLREAMVKVFEKDPELLTKWNRYNSANAQ